MFGMRIYVFSYAGYSVLALRSALSVKQTLLVNKCYPSYQKLLMSSTNKKRDKALDVIVERESKIRHALKLKDFLQQKEMHVIDMQSVNNLKHDLGFKQNQKISSCISKYPGMFKVTKDEGNERWLEFSNEMEDILETETTIFKKHHESYLAIAVQKLLMMCPEGRVSLVKFGHMRRSFGLPHDFATNFVHQYPQHFRVIAGTDGPDLELVSWNPYLAVTEREKKIQALQKELGDDGAQISPHAFPITIKKGYTPAQKSLERLEAFQLLPFLSPYEHTNIPAGLASAEARKRVVGIAHEFLSLTLEKRALVDHISHCKREFNLPGRVEALLDLYPFIFYVSPKGDRHTVFLREAYKGDILLDRSPMLAIKDRISEFQKAGLRRDSIQPARVNTNNNVTKGHNDQSNEVDESDEVDESEFEIDDNNHQDANDNEDGEADYEVRV